MSFYRRCVRCFAVLITCCVAVIAEEQPPAKPAHLVGMIGLIVREPVLKELGIANDSQELAEIRQTLKPFSAVLQQRLNHPTEEDRAHPMTAQDLYAKVEAEFVSDLKSKLTPEQFTRLQQIHWQRWGIRSIEDSELATQLELTHEQISKAAAARLDVQARRKELEVQRREQQQKGANVAEFRQRIQDLDQELATKYGEILTSEQSEKFAVLKGKPFDLPDNPPNTNAGMPVRTTPGGTVALAMMEPVLEELGINPVSPTVMELRKLSRAHAAELQQLLRSRSGGLDVRENARRIEHELQVKYDVDLKKLLTPDQFNRLYQIHWQRLGTEAFNDPEIIQTLEISAEQQARLVALNLEIFKRTRELLNPPEGRPVGAPISEEVQKKLQEAVADKTARAFEILSKNQQGTWAEIQGKPFDLSLLRRSVQPRPAAP